MYNISDILDGMYTYNIPNVSLCTDFMLFYILENYIIIYLY